MREEDVWEQPGAQVHGGCREFQVADSPCELVMWVEAAGDLGRELFL